MSVQVWAHDSGQRHNWAFSRIAVERDRSAWFDTIDRYNNMPRECVGDVIKVDLSLIDDNDVYVG